MKSWKCRIGSHDWEQVTDRDKDRESRDNDGIQPWLYDYLCIRPGCHQLNFEATEARMARAKAKLDTIEREKTANEKAKLNIVTTKLVL